MAGLVPLSFHCCDAAVEIDEVGSRKIARESKNAGPRLLQRLELLVVVVAVELSLLFLRWLLTSLMLLRLLPVVLCSACRRALGP